MSTELDTRDWNGGSCWDYYQDLKTKFGEQEVALPIIDGVLTTKGIIIPSEIQNETGVYPFYNSENKTTSSETMTHRNGLLSIRDGCKASIGLYEQYEDGSKSYIVVFRS